MGRFFICANFNFGFPLHRRGAGGGLGGFNVYPAYRAFYPLFFAAIVRTASHLLF